MLKVHTPINKDNVHNANLQVAKEHRIAQAIGASTIPTVGAIEVSSHNGTPAFYKYYMCLTIAKSKLLAYSEFLTKPLFLVLLQDIINKLKIFHQTKLSPCSSGLVHLDLKPENIMIDDNNQVRLIDFGLSQPAGTLHEKFKIQQYIPPRHNIPPECFATTETSIGTNDQFTCSHKQDLFSCAYTMVAMLDHNKKLLPQDKEALYMLAFSIIYTGTPAELLELIRQSPNPLLQNLPNRQLKPLEDRTELDVILSQMNAYQQGASIISAILNPEAERTSPGYWVAL